jgi:DNA-binding MarR family transcriptional regulator
MDFGYTARMELHTTSNQELVLAIASNWDRLLGQLDSGLSHIKGISFAEYRLLRAIAESPQGRGSRVDLADRVGLSASGVTRALRPLEKLGFVETQRAERDARLALAMLTAHGEELVRDASGVVDDIADSIANDPSAPFSELAG